MFSTFWLEWSVHFIPTGMEWSHSIPAGMEGALPSGRNRMTTPFLQKWNDSIPSQPEWNDYSIPAGMECQSTPNLKKYAARGPQKMATGPGNVPIPGFLGILSNFR